MQSIESLKQLAVFDRDRIEHVLVVHNGLRAAAQFDDIGAQYSDVATLDILGNPRFLPYAGRYEGRSEIVGVLRRMGTDVEFISTEVLDVLVDHNRAMLRARARLRHRGTGLTLSQEIWDVFDFEDGLIVSQTKHFDLQTFRRLCAG
jgi:hypothetical protein